MAVRVRMIEDEGGMQPKVRVEVRANERMLYKERERESASNRETIPGSAKAAALANVSDEVEGADPYACPAMMHLMVRLCMEMGKYSYYHNAVRRVSVIMNVKGAV